MRIFILLFICCLYRFSYAQNQVPAITNLNATVSTGQVTVTYDLSDLENDLCDVRLLLSSNGGQTYISRAGSISGDVGISVIPGLGKQITWNYDTVSNIYAYSLRIVADDKQLPNIQDIVDEVDSNLLLTNLQFIQGIRHYQADPLHLEEVKDSIESRFIRAGLETTKQDFTKDGYLGQNVIGRKAGLGKEDTAFIIDAHFDSVNDAPGADDNGSGVAGVLEALRVLAPYNFTKTIRFIGFDFEETVGIGGTEGSIRYVQSQVPSWEKLQGVANFEMIGYYTEQPNTQQIPFGFNFLYPAQYNTVAADSFRGNFICNVGDGESMVFVNQFDSLSHQYVPALKVMSLTIGSNGFLAPDFRRSDHANFWDIDVPALLLTDGANFRNIKYHTPGDTIGNLNFTFMTNVVKATVATIASLAGIQHSSFSDFDLAPLSIPKTNLNCQLQLYPVPVKSAIIIQGGECFDGSFTFRLFDIEGKEVFSKEIVSRNSEIQMAQIPIGVYFAVFGSKKGNLVKKFVKE